MADEEADRDERDQEPEAAAGDAGHEKLARSAEKEADELEQRSQEVGQQISETRDEWERKQASDSVPGAVGDPEQSSSESGRSSSQSGATEKEGDPPDSADSDQDEHSDSDQDEHSDSDQDEHSDSDHDEH